MVIWLGLMPVTATTSLPKSTEKEPTESASMETLDEVLEAWDTESLGNESHCGVQRASCRERRGVYVARWVDLHERPWLIGQMRF